METFSNSLNFYIQENYKINNNPSHHDDRSYTDQGQDEVYKYARHLSDENSLDRIIDVGCGSGYKLMKYFFHKDTVGIETEPCLSFLKSKYPSRVWINSGEPEKSFEFSNLSCDILICCDVIEHIINPNNLIEFLSNIDFKYLIISTPDRNILRYMEGYGDKAWQGPPVNPAHVREWTMNEFDNYISKSFNIISKSHCSIQGECMFFVCTKK